MSVSGETRENKNEQTLMNLNTEKNLTGNDNKNTDWLMVYFEDLYKYTKQSRVVKKEWGM